MNQFYVKVTSKIPTLVVKLAKETYFGKTLMQKCSQKHKKTTRSPRREAGRIEAILDEPFP